MKKIKNLHIIPNDKFNKEFIEFINKNFNKEEHYFLLISVPSSRVYNISEDTNSNVLNYEFKTPKKSILRVPLLATQLIKFYRILYSLSKKAEKVFFHDASNYQIPFLYIFKGILKKSYYVIWSTEKSKYEKKFFIGSMFRYVKGNFKGYITLMKGDFDLIKKWYGTKGKLYLSFTYPSNFYKKITLENLEKNEIVIQVGNSAQVCNNHLEILEKLKKFKNKNIKLYCILSYGNDGGDNYLTEVITTGKNIFGDKFIPVTNFMEYSEYLSYLAKIDIAIFAHNMQKAFGNISSLLSMKKTVYLKESISTFETLKEIGVEIKSFDKFIDLEKFDENILENNRRIMEENFSEEKLIEQWKNIFEN
jgi:4-alpha-L-fucosyltransferase (fuc4NAc transferase)